MESNVVSLQNQYAHDMRKILFLLLAFLCLSVGSKTSENISVTRADTSAFVLVSDVIPDAILEIRYFTAYNFIGDRIPGYEEPVAIMTKQSADSLKAVADDLRSMGYVIKVFDAYRPQRAVDYFMKWGDDAGDVRMKEIFYPKINKASVIPLGYVARRSSHTHGSTVDLTLVDMKSGREVDMGSPFDYFGGLSSPDIQPGSGTLTEQQYHNRMILRDAMLSHGFKPYSGEWWHFTLKNEPFPDTFFDFPVRTESVK